MTIRTTESSSTSTRRVASHGAGYPKSLSELRKILSEKKRLYNLRQEGDGQVRHGAGRTRWARGDGPLRPSACGQGHAVASREVDPLPPRGGGLLQASVRDDQIRGSLVDRRGGAEWLVRRAANEIPSVRKTLDCKLQAFLPTAPSGADDVFIDVDPRGEPSSGIRKKIRDPLRKHSSQRDGNRKITGRIDAPDTMPLKRVIAVLNAVPRSRTARRVDFAGIERAPREIRDLKVLPR